MTDAHLHLQDERLAPFLGDVLEKYAALGIARVVVNGTSESDWPRVADLAAAHPDIVVPSFGLHPWYVGAASPGWQKSLTHYLDTVPGACVGEAGLDRWIEGNDPAQQEPVFRYQMQLAAERNRPLSIHCLRAWGRMLEILQEGPLPACGFLLHSYGGPAEMIPAFARLGGYFSFSGYYLRPRKADRREALRQIPADRLLIETDAPDMPLPDNLVRWPLPDALNHPANLPVICAEAAAILRDAPQPFARRIDRNFTTLFG